MKAFSVIGHGGLEERRFPQCLHNPIRDGGVVVNLTRLPRFTSQKHSYFCLYYRGMSTKQIHGHVAAGRTTYIEKKERFVYLIGS
jgi:hypothetical protein